MTAFPFDDTWLGPWHDRPDDLGPDDRDFDDEEEVPEVMNRYALERKLVDQLRRDRKHPSRCRVEGDTVIVTPSGTACGLAMRIAGMTGEDDEAVMNRVTSQAESVSEGRLLHPEDILLADLCRFDAKLQRVERLVGLMWQSTFHETRVRPDDFGPDDLDDDRFAMAMWDPQLGWIDA